MSPSLSPPGPGEGAPCVGLAPVLLGTSMVLFSPEASACTRENQQPAVSISLTWANDGVEDKDCSLVPSLKLFAPEGTIVTAGGV